MKKIQIALIINFVVLSVNANADYRYISAPGLKVRGIYTDEWPISEIEISLLSVKKKVNFFENSHRVKFDNGLGFVNESCGNGKGILCSQAINFYLPLVSYKKQVSWLLSGSGSIITTC